MKPLVGFVTLVMLLCSTVVTGQTSIGYPAMGEVSYNYFGGSARAMGMGYAFVGLSNDVSGGLWNPAGLWVLESPIISASYSIYSPAGEWDDSWSPGTTQNNISLNGIGHFSFVAPVRVKGHPWVFTFNYNRNNEYSKDEAWLYDVSSGLNPDTYHEESGFLRAYKVGASTRIFKQLSVGFTVNIFDANRVNQTTSLAVRDTIIDPVYGTTGTLQEEIQSLDSTKSNGFNFNLGMMWKQEKFSVGVSVHNPFTMTHTSDHTFHMVTTLNDLINVDNTGTIFVVDSIAKQDIPLSVIFGLGFFPNEKLTLSADFSYQNYGSTNWFYRTRMFFEPNGERTDYFEEIPIDWNNTAGLGFGAEYMLDSKFGQIPLRAGFRFDQLPQPATFDVTQTNVGYYYDSETDSLVLYYLGATVISHTAKDRQSSKSFSLGTGIHWSQLDLDLGYMYTTGAEMKIINQSFWYDEDSEGNPIIWYATFERTEKAKAHEFRVTLTGHF